MYIGITTFKERFDSHFVPLIKDLSGFNVIVAVNASNKTGLDNEYRRRMLSFLSEYDNVSPIFYQEMRGLAKMWNDLVIHCPVSHMLLLNDDVRVKNAKVLMRSLNETAATKSNFFLINGSFSHFVIAKHTLEDLNWFDERFLGFGEEDGDMIFRHIERYGFFPMSLRSAYITNLTSEIRDENVKPGIAKYSLFNRCFAGFYECDIPNLPKKYTPDQDGISGMFGCKMKTQIESPAMYPHESFFNEFKKYL